MLWIRFAISGLLLGGVIACTARTDRAATPPAESPGRLTMTLLEDRGWLIEGDFRPQSPERSWLSPLVAAEPLQYFRIDVESYGDLFIGMHSANPAADWGRRGTDRGERGVLVADDWTGFRSPRAWSRHVYFSRARCNAEAVGVEIARGEARSVRVQPASRLAVHNWADRLYAAMPPIGYQPPADRFDRLRRVRSKLREGRDVTIICLGDSIMNDTGNSTLDVLLERAYRYRGDASVRVLTAVGSGAGMQHWNDDLNRNWPGQDLDLAQAVLARKPDLVMIGGISTRGGFHHFEQIVDRIRVGVEGRYGYWPDVLLMTGPFGRRADSPAWRERRRVRQAEYSAALREVARRKHTAFFDIAGAVDRYIADAQEAGWQPADFYRDGVHANHYGKQLLGRLLLDHLGP